MIPPTTVGISARPVKTEAKYFTVNGCDEFLLINSEDLTNLYRYGCGGNPCGGGHFVQQLSQFKGDHYDTACKEKECVRPLM